MGRRTRPVSPLPPRDGVGAARVRMPQDGAWPTVVAFLVAVTGDPAGVASKVAAGEVVLGDGAPVSTDTAYRGGAVVHLYRDLPEEIPVPGDIPILLRDDETGLIAVDKPPFLATMPRGRHVRQSVVVRLRQQLGLPEVSPIHRLDRLTSGVLLLTTRREARGSYQRLVQDGGLLKSYLALAPVRADLPAVVENRLVKRRGELQVRVEAGEPNARTELTLLDTVVLGGARLGRYRLTPVTGRTHQLRVHLAGSGVPIVGDPLYPVVRDVAPGDFSEPLQLLAERVRFTDPVNGRSRDIRSARALPIRPPDIS